jgi:D-3-phosphoglycerate dehydrogenase
VEGLRTDYFGRVAERDTRLLSLEVLRGVLDGHVEEEVNAVNAPAIAEERGLSMTESKHMVARDYADFMRVEVIGGETPLRVAGTLIGRRHRPHLIEAWGQRFDVQLEDHVTVFRYQDLPGMLGRVGTAFGAHGVNIVSAAVGRQPGDDPSGDGRLAALVITTTTPVPATVVEEIVSSEGFVAGQTVAL